MSLTRWIGKLDVLPNHYIELVKNQKKEVVHKLVYDENYHVIPTYKLTCETKKVVDAFDEKKEFNKLNSEDFSTFIRKRKEWRELMRSYYNAEDSDSKVEGFEATHVDNLFDGRIYAGYYCNEAFSYIIFNYSENNPNYYGHDFFIKEELTYPSTLYFLRSSIKLNKVSMFNSPADKPDYLCYKTADRLYIAEINKERKVSTILVYDNNYSDVTDSQDVTDVKDKMDMFLYKSYVVSLAQDYLPSLRD